MISNELEDQMNDVEIEPNIKIYILVHTRLMRFFIFAMVGVIFAIPKNYIIFIITFLFIIEFHLLNSFLKTYQLFIRGNFIPNDIEYSQSLQAQNGWFNKLLHGAGMGIIGNIAFNILMLILLSIAYWQFGSTSGDTIIEGIFGKLNELIPNK